MGEHLPSLRLSRRAMLAGMGGMACLPTLGVADAAGRESPPPAPEVAKPADIAKPAAAIAEGPQKALEALAVGNRRFVTGKTRHAHRAALWRSHLLDGQEPFATILGCSDSRVPVELVFDQGFGDLFVVRVAGNIVDPATFGSIGYGIEHLKTPLVVVLGHEQCGAVTAALNELRNDVSDRPAIDALLDFVKPSLANIDSELSMTKQVAQGVEANVRRAVEQLVNAPAAKSEIDAGRIRIVGAVYDLKTGQVRFLR